MSKQPKIFTFYFWKRFLTDNNKIKWKVRQTGKEYIVDVIECNVMVETHTRSRNPRAVMKGRGKVELMKYKEKGQNKTKAIIR